MAPHQRDNQKDPAAAAFKKCFNVRLSKQEIKVSLRQVTGTSCFVCMCLLNNQQLLRTTGCSVDAFLAYCDGLAAKAGNRTKVPIFWEATFRVLQHQAGPV